MRLRRFDGARLPGRNLFHQPLRSCPIALGLAGALSGRNFSLAAVAAFGSRSFMRRLQRRLLLRSDLWGAIPSAAALVSYCARACGAPGATRTPIGNWRPRGGNLRGKLSGRNFSLAAVAAFGSRSFMRRLQRRLLLRSDLRGLSGRNFLLRSDLRGARGNSHANRHAFA